VNYLAHAYLSGDNEDVLIGNFIADHVRGNNFSNYSQGVIEGIRLHRKIDAFTDTHPLFQSSKRVFYTGFEKYSGILVDIYFDYFLAKQFSHFHRLSLDEFSANVYSRYTKNIHQMPESSARFLSYVINNNIYSNYANIRGIETVLTHLSQRIGHNVLLQNSIEVFQKNEVDLNEKFNHFAADILKKFKIHDFGFL
jgi:acyl carrier protein phosphodiesterase